MALGLSLPANTASAATATRQATQTNMSPESLAALELLIAQLMGGGTQDMANQEAIRQTEINRTRAQQASYSKDAAFADAQGAMAAQLVAALQKTLPTITRGAEAAGTSQNSMRALLAQDAAGQAAEGAATVGLNAATQYGQISSALAGVLANMTQPNNAATKALLDALNIAKGAVQTTTETTNQIGGSGGGSSNSNSGSGGGSSVSNTGNASSMNLAGILSSGGIPLAGGNVYYGPQISDSQLVDMISRGTTSANAGAIANLVNNNSWQGFQF